MTLYDIKPQFQSILRPIVKRLAIASVTANQITLFAMAGSIAVSALVSIFAHINQVFLLLPIWMFIRMALNAVDGMLAREFKQKTDLGVYLNELCDVISDTALFIPFAFILPFSLTTVGLVIFLSVLSELAGVLGQTIGASRRYVGPMGNSDRALVFGALGLWIGVGGVTPNWLYWMMPLLSVLIIQTTVNRIKRALQEAS